MKISKIQNIKTSSRVILRWRHSEHKAKFEKNGLFSLGPKQVFLIYFLKDCPKKFWKIQNSIAVENSKLLLLCLIEWWPLKLFAKLHKSLLLIASIVKDALLGLRQFLATESTLKNRFQKIAFISSQQITFVVGKSNFAHIMYFD